MKRILFIVFGFFSFINSFAQSSHKTTLQEAVTMGLTNSHTLQISKAKMDAAKAKYQQAIDQALPTLKLSAGYTRLSDIDEFKVDFGNTGHPVALFPNIPNNYSSRLALGETVFSGFRLKYAMASQQLLRDASKIDAAKDSQEVVMNVINGLFNLYKINQTHQIVNENITLAQKRVDEAINWEKNGIATHNEVLKWQLQLSNTELAKIDLDNTYEVSNFNMNLLLGLDGNQKLDVDSLSLFSSVASESFSFYDANGLKSRPEIQSLVLKNETALNYYNIAKNSYWPIVSVGANYYYSRPNSRIFPLVDEWNSTWDVGINLSFDIINLYSNHHVIAEAQANIDQTKAQQAQLTDAIRSEVNQAFITYSQSKEREKVLLRAVDQAEENYRITENKYRSQLVLQTELQDADNALLKSRIEKVNATADTQYAYYRLLKASGLLSKTY